MLHKVTKNSEDFRPPLTSVGTTRRELQIKTAIGLILALFLIPLTTMINLSPAAADTAVPSTRVYSWNNIRSSTMTVLKSDITHVKNYTQSTGRAGTIVLDATWLCNATTAQDLKKLKTQVDTARANNLEVSVLLGDPALYGPIGYNKVKAGLNKLHNYNVTYPGSAVTNIELDIEPWSDPGWYSNTEALIDGWTASVQTAATYEQFHLVVAVTDWMWNYQPQMWQNAMVADELSVMAYKDSAWRTALHYDQAAAASSVPTILAINYLNDEPGTVLGAGEETVLYAQYDTMAINDENHLPY